MLEEVALTLLCPRGMKVPMTINLRIHSVLPHHWSISAGLHATDTLYHSSIGCFTHSHYLPSQPSSLVYVRVESSRDRAWIAAVFNYVKRERVHHHHLFWKRPLFHAKLGLWRLPQIKSCPHILKNSPLRMQTKQPHVIPHTLFPLLPRPLNHQPSASRHPIIHTLTFHLNLPCLTTSYGLVVYLISVGKQPFILNLHWKMEVKMLYIHQNNWLI